MVMLTELRGDLVPAGMVLWIAVDKQKRLPSAAVSQPYDGPAGAHIEVLKAREVRRHLGRTPAKRISGIVGEGCHVLLRLDVGRADHLFGVLACHGISVLLERAGLRPMPLAASTKKYTTFPRIENGLDRTTTDR